MSFILKLFLTLHLVVLTFSANSQSIIIDYEFEINDVESPSSNFTSRYKLYDNLNYAIYIRNNTNYYQDSSTIQVEEKAGHTITRLSDEHLVIQSDNKSETFIDRVNNKVYDQNMIATKPFIVEENLPLIDWVLTNKDTVYLNIPCKIAQTEFRGRSWTVFFTDSLGFNAAPWKLYGLPGTVLYAVTSDGRFTMRVTGIVLHKNSIEIKNPFQNIEKKYSWKEYKKEYKDFNRKYVKSMNASMPGANITIKTKSGLEDMGFD